MRITVVGSGAIGSLWAVQLHLAGHRVQLWTRTKETDIDRILDGNQVISFTANDPVWLTESDCVLVTVKAFHVKTALAQIKPHLHPDTPVILMHNGMGTLQPALEVIGETPLLLATTAQGCLKTTDSMITHTGFGPTHLGGANENGRRCEFLADVYNHALAPAHWQQDIIASLWQKLAINCAINPLTAIHKVKNGTLLTAPYTDVLQSLSAEIAEVMQAEGIETDAEKVLSSICSVASATANNFSSMNRDLHYRRTTEVDYINGYLVARAKVHGIQVPQNEKLLLQIKQMASH